MPDKKKSDGQPSGISDAALDEALWQALRASGKLMPEDEADIAAMEKWIAQNGMEIPPSLSAAPTAPPHDRDEISTISPICDSAVNLAWAARNGKEIESNVRRKMNEDRDNAEAQAREPRAE